MATDPDNWPPRWVVLDRMVSAWYDLEGNICGGALHVILDDGNLDDTHIVGTYQWLLTNDDFASQRAFGLAILHELAMMEVGERGPWYDRHITETA